MEPKLLIVEDETNMLEEMQTYLQREGFQVHTCQNGREALELAQSEQPELVVLDWMLPEKSGLDVCRELRQVSNCGIIMVTARSEESDKIVGLEIGADDYLTKPFSLRELATRIRALLRRMHGSENKPQLLKRDNLTISEAKCQVYKDGQEIQLTPTEFKILYTLAARPGIVFSRLQLLKVALGDEYMGYERTMDSHIRNLRRKLEDLPSNPRYIQTVYGFGYRFGEQT
ncbi:DNA-binding response regulator, OmpR family, contains REC and winged-helix (wHTH) domain [Seinonella peptonophila]|uniref:DNA-binding response regulator, OmpR family, contains REC and winged-helix (WHTH) domain n=1 Tax=Seinonella peptonophila TaxID=112248 RepID=A0A1M4X607_9BACL|nr:response regulator transcription factor [Seinonella peptonophila]SHE88891.1 DNA-binding response regulator, OmpR family, contains REC and winged-helix (wHTH) domain [Seinonella peptonophila]